MKKKPISLSRKLSLNKETIAALSNNDQHMLMGGATAAACVRQTVLNCAPVTEDDMCCQLTRYCPVQTDNCQ